MYNTLFSKISLGYTVSLTTALPKLETPVSQFVFVLQFAASKRKISVTQLLVKRRKENKILPTLVL